MVTYRSKKHPNIVIVSDGIVDPKYKTVLVTFANGKTQSMQSTTLADKWEVVDSSEFFQQPKEENIDPDEPSVTSSIAVLAESVATTMGGQLKLWDSKPNIISITAVDGKSAMEIYTGKKSFKVRVRPEILQPGEEYTPHKYVFGATISLDYDAHGYSTLESLITRSIVYKANKPKKTKKRHKEES